MKVHARSMVERENQRRSFLVTAHFVELNQERMILAAGLSSSFGCLLATSISACMSVLSCFVLYSLI